MYNLKIIKRFFSEQILKKPKMELTIRTPYKTYLNQSDNFERILTKTNLGALSIQNRSPSSVFILPPGLLKVKLTKEVESFNGELLHTGGWCVVHPDNTCDINLIDAFQKDELTVENIENFELEEKDNTLSEKYAEKIRNSAKKVFIKHIIK